MLKELLEISMVDLFIISFKIMLVVIACSLVIGIFSITSLFLMRKLGMLDNSSF